MDINLLQELNEKLRSQQKYLSQINADKSSIKKLTQQIVENEERIRMIDGGRLKSADDLIKKTEKLLELSNKAKSTTEKLKGAYDELKEIGSDFTDSLFETLGISKELFKTGIAIGIGLTVAKKASEAISTAFDSTVGLAKDMYKNTGATVGEAAKIGFETAKASLSMTGLIYGAESVAEASKTIKDYFNSTRIISSDMIKNVTELNAMLENGGNAAQLSQIFKNASGDASQLTDDIKEIAHKEGVSASAVFSEMANNANLLVGKTKEEIKLLSKKTTEMVKQGASMELMNSISENVLDIESSIAAQNKARLFGININTSAIRDAAVAYQYGAGSVSELTDAILDTVVSSEEFGKMAPGVQRIYADAAGMTTEELTDLLVKQEALNEQTEKYGKEGDTAFSTVTSTAQSALPAFAQASTLLKNMGVPTEKLMGKVGGLFSKFGKVGDLFGKKSGPGANILSQYTSPAPFDPSSTSTPTQTRGPRGGPTGALGGINATSLIKGAAALLIMAAALFVFAKALQEFKDVGVDELGMAAGSIILLGGALIGLSYALAPLAASGILFMVAAGMLALGAAVYLVGAGFKLFAEGAKILSELPAIFVPLAELAGGIALFGLALYPLSIGLGALAIGLAAMRPVIPTLVALVALGAGIALIANALNGGGGGSSTETSGGSDKKSKDPLLTEIQELRKDLQTLLPGNVILNNNIVGKINRSSRAINSYVNKNG